MTEDEFAKSIDINKKNGRRADAAAITARATVAVSEGRIVRDADGNMLSIKPNRRERRARASAQRSAGR